MNHLAQSIELNPNKAIIKISNYSESPSLLNYKVLCFLEYILPDKIRQEHTMIQTEPHHLRMGTRLNNRISYSRSSWRRRLWHYLCRMDEVLCQKVAVKEFFPRGAITRNNQQTNEVVSVYGTKAANFQPGRGEVPSGGPDACTV